MAPPPRRRPPLGWGSPLRPGPLLRGSRQHRSGFSVVETIGVFDLNIISIEMTGEPFRMRAFDIPKDELDRVVIDPMVAAGRLKGGEADIMELRAREQVGP